MSEIWNKKSSKYPRFSRQLKIFQEAFFINLKDFGVDFNDKSVVDIGCGTGVYTLHIAKMSKQITGVDSSNAMLKLLCDDAKDNEIKNVKTINSTWESFMPTKCYDIAISTMSPAISSIDDFVKFKNMARVKVYMNFARQRSSSLIDPFFQKFNVKGKCGTATTRLEKWLIQNQFEFKKVTFGESREIKRDKEDAIENICWHLDINEAKYDKNEISNMLDINYKDKIIDEKIDSLITLFVF